MSLQINAKAERDLTSYSKRLVQRGLVVGPGGNVSMRDGDVVWISPSGYTLDDIPADHWVPVDITSGVPVNDHVKPSSETLMHLAIYRARRDVQAIVHTHPPTTIGVVSAGLEEIPLMFPDQAAVVGKTAFIEYVVPCSEELAEAVVAKARNQECYGLLLQNHGLITLGSNLREAYYRTEVVESAAQVFWVATSVGTPRILSSEEASEILELDAEKYRQELLKRTSRP